MKLKIIAIWASACAVMAIITSAHGQSGRPFSREELGRMIVQLEADADLAKERGTLTNFDYAILACAQRVEKKVRSNAQLDRLCGEVAAKLAERETASRLIKLPMPETKPTRVS